MVHQGVQGLRRGEHPQAGDGAPPNRRLQREHDGSVRRDPNDRDRPGGRGDDRSLHEVRDRTDGSRVLSPPEANLLRLSLRSNDLAAPQIPDDTGATPAMGRERPAAEPARTWRSTTSCVGNGSTPSAYKAGGRGRTDRGDNRTPAAGAGE